MPPRGMPQNQGLHHGFGHSDSFASPQMSKHTHAMMKVTDHNTVGNDLGVERPMNMWIKFGEFSPIYPTPETPQYGCWAKDSLERENKVQEEFCSKLEDFGCFGRANLRGVCDTATMSFAERMVTPWQWTFIHADGWNINFWPENFHMFKDTGKDDGSVCPIASLDIRQILAANYQREASSSEGALAPFEVHVNFQTGYFPFRVVDELEAQEWCVRIMKGVVETVKVQQVREKYMQHHNKMDELEVEAHRIERDPVRCQKLADLWHQAVESVERGARPTRQIFFELYALYDCLDLPPEYGESFAEEEERRGDGNLTMYEIEVLCREFLDMKYHEVQAIVVRQEKDLFHPHRPVGASREHSLRWTIDQGRELMEHYQNQRNPKDFFDRVVNFHHRCDISREGRVDPQEFLNAAPVFLMPNMELRKEGLFFASAEESSPDAHRERRQEHGAPEPEEEEESGGCDDDSVDEEASIGGDDFGDEDMYEGIPQGIKPPEPIADLQKPFGDLLRAGYAGKILERRAFIEKISNMDSSPVQVVADCRRLPGAIAAGQVRRLDWPAGGMHTNGW